MATIISLFNHKGDVGKTIRTLNCAPYEWRHGGKCHFDDKTRAHRKVK